jgi:hypothetical protein
VLVGDDAIHLFEKGVGMLERKQVQVTSFGGIHGKVDLSAEELNSEVNPKDTSLVRAKMKTGREVWIPRKILTHLCQPSARISTGAMRNLVLDSTILILLIDMVMTRR